MAIRNEASASDVFACESIVQGILSGFGLKDSMHSKESLLRKKQRLKLILWRKEKNSCTECQLKQMIWNGESKISIFGMMVGNMRDVASGERFVQIAFKRQQRILQVL